MKWEKGDSKIRSKGLNTGGSDKRLRDVTKRGGTCAVARLEGLRDCVQVGERNEKARDSASLNLSALPDHDRPEYPHPWPEWGSVQNYPKCQALTVTLAKRML